MYFKHKWCMETVIYNYNCIHIHSSPYSLSTSFCEFHLQLRLRRVKCSQSDYMNIKPKAPLRGPRKKQGVQHPIRMGRYWSVILRSVILRQKQHESWAFIGLWELTGETDKVLYVNTKACPSNDVVYLSHLRNVNQIIIVWCNMIFWETIENGVLMLWAVYYIKQYLLAYWANTHAHTHTNGLSVQTQGYHIWFVVGM